MAAETRNAVRNPGDFEAIAASWERRREEIEGVTTPVREWLLRELAPREGETVLELAAGVGDTGFAAAAQLGPRGRLITSDVSPAMLDAARRRGAALGVENVEYRVVDAERTGLPDESADGVLCRFGLMLMSDPAAALAETWRVLRPGGRLALAVWGPPDRNPCFAVIGSTLVRRGQLEPPPPPPAPGIFSLGSAARLEELLRAAGFVDVRHAEVPVRFVQPDVDEYLKMVVDTAGPIAPVLRGLTVAERDAVEADVEKAFAPFAGVHGYEIPGLALCARASRP